MSSEPAMLDEQDGHVDLLALNRPEMRNPASETDVVAGLPEACEALDALVQKRPSGFSGQ